MRYVQARYSAYQREWAYRFYIAENLRIIGENTAKALIRGGVSTSKTLQDFIEDLFKPQDTRKADEIITDVINKAGLEVKNESI